MFDRALKELSNDVQVDEIKIEILLQMNFKRRTLPFPGEITTEMSLT
jgi:hypothetical protein